MRTKKSRVIPDSLPMPDKKVSFLLPDAMTQYEALQNQADSAKNFIEDRINYIIQTIYASFGERLSCWYFDGAGEGETGDLLRAYSHDFISLHVEPYPSGQGFSIINKDGGEWGLSSEIPTRWLFEDFEDELKKGIIAYYEAQNKKSVVRSKNKEAKEAKRREVLNKLTAEEQKILGIK